MLVTADEVGIQQGQTYTGDDLERVNSFITDVSSLIESYCRKTFSDPVPSAIKAVALLEVRRYLNSEPGVASENVSELSTSYAYGGAAILLSSSAQASLDAYLRWTSPRMGYIRLVSPVTTWSWRADRPEAPTSQVGGDIVISGRTYLDELVQVQVSTDGVVWTDIGFAESQDISDGLRPYWQVTYPAPVGDATYKWRCRTRHDGTTSRWSLAVTTVYTAV